MKPGSSELVSMVTVFQEVEFFGYSSYLDTYGGESVSIHRIVMCTGTRLRLSSMCGTFPPWFHLDTSTSPVLLRVLPKNVIRGDLHTEPTTSPKVVHFCPPCKIRLQTLPFWILVDPFQKSHSPLVSSSIHNWVVLLSV